MTNLVNTSDDLWQCINSILDNKFNQQDLSYKECVALRQLQNGAKEIIEMENQINTLLYNEHLIKN